MKKIAFLIAYPKFTAFEKLSKALGQRYEMECYVWNRTGDYHPDVTADNISYITCDLRSGYYKAGTLINLFLFQFWLIYRLLISKADCVHAFNLSTGLAGFLAARLKRIPFVYHCLDPYYSILPDSWPKAVVRLVQRMENFLVTNADFFVITDMLRMPQHEGARPKQVVEFANISQFDIPHEGKPFGQGTFRIGYIGSLTTGRNLETIVHAAGELKDEGVELLIGGHGPLGDTIKALAGQYNNVEFTSWVPYSKLFEIEKDFDLFIQMTENTKRIRWGSPNKLFESMFFAKPIIVGEDTLAAERVAIIGNGVAVPCGDREQLKDAILRLKNDPAASIEMGKRGREDYERNWHPAIMRKRIVDAYERILPSGQPVE